MNSGRVGVKWVMDLNMLKKLLLVLKMMDGCRIVVFGIVVNMLVLFLVLECVYLDLFFVLVLIVDIWISLLMFVVVFVFVIVLVLMVCRLEKDW